MPRRVVLTGSECTGKTTLARELGERYGAPVSGEFARRYLDEKRAPLVAADVAPIARGQIAVEDAAMRTTARLVVHDTDLVSTVIYARHYYGSCPSWIERAARERLADLYLLLEPDVSWVPDALYRDRPGERERIHGLFEELLRSWEAPTVGIRGGWPVRAALAVAVVERLLAGGAI